ncbi:MAG: hypothetical protein K2P35_09445, partial [Lachnospiraceae bacterium]|nr:hypothetical protein [Lachnospiraceae bacterium]
FVFKSQLAGPKDARYAAGRSGAAGSPEGMETGIFCPAKEPAGTDLAILMWQEKTAGCTASFRKKTTSIFTVNARRTGGISGNAAESRRRGCGMWGK